MSYKNFPGYPYERQRRLTARVRRRIAYRRGRWIRRVVRAKWEVQAAFLYAVASGLGLGYSVLFYWRLGLDYMAFSGPSDYLVAFLVNFWPILGVIVLVAMIYFTLEAISPARMMASMLYSPDRMARMPERKRKMLKLVSTIYPPQVLIGFMRVSPFVNAMMFAAYAAALVIAPIGSAERLLNSPEATETEILGWVIGRRPVVCLEAKGAEDAGPACGAERYLLVGGTSSYLFLLQIAPGAPYAAPRSVAVRKDEVAVVREP